jgi:hypothetical protein
MSEVNLEIGLMLSLLYLFIEVNRAQVNDGFDLELGNFYIIIILFNILI